MFITFEGIEHCGKSSTAKAIYEMLKADGYDVILTREPGGTQIAEQIRNILLDKQNAAMAPETEALLYAAARAQHWVEKIQPALDAGTIVLCDRWLGSSVAYQGCARELGVAKVVEVNDFGVKGARPDLEFILDVPPQIAFDRVKGQEQDRLESEPMEFHKKIYEFFANHESEKSYAVKIDGTLEPDIITREIYKKIIGLISLKKDKKDL